MLTKDLKSRSVIRKTSKRTEPIKRQAQLQTLSLLEQATLSKSRHLSLSLSKIQA